METEITDKEATAMQRFQRDLMLNGRPGESNLTHVFTPGLYTRTAEDPAGSMILSIRHKTEHPFIISKGKAEVYAEENGEIVSLGIISAPFMGITKPGTQRAIKILEDCIWTTFHPTEAADFAPIESTDPTERQAVIVARIEGRIRDPWENPLLTPEFLAHVEQIRECRRQADALMAARRAEAPDGCDPQNSSMITFEVVGLIVSVTGAVMQHNAAEDSAAAQTRLANLNFLSQRQNAEQAIETASLQYQQNQTLADQQARAQNANATALADQAKAVEAQGRVSTDKGLEDNARLTAIARARLAHSGVVEAGTPVDDLADMAGQGALALEQQHWQAAGQSSNLQFEAQLAKNDATMTEFGAQIQGFKDKSGEVAAQNAITSAALNRLAGFNQANQMSTAAGGTLLTNLGSTAQTASKFNWKST